MNILTSLEI